MRVPQSDSKSLSQLQLEPVHFAFVSFVIVTGQMQKPVQNQLLHLIRKAEAIVPRLRRRTLH
jgi:hypothetical protein